MHLISQLFLLDICKRFHFLRLEESSECLNSLTRIKRGLFSLTVQILEESSARPWSLELQPCSQVYPVLLLQEYCPLHH